MSIGRMRSLFTAAALAAGTGAGAGVVVGAAATVAAGVAAAASPLAGQIGTAVASPGLASQVDSVAAAVLEATGVPSASVAVVKDGALAYARAYGQARLEPRTPASADMRYAIGSISKQFTAAAALLLVEDGKLSLDDPVSKWLPELNLTDADRITVRQLLSHTSGYQDFWPEDYVPLMMLHDISPEDIARRWAGRPLNFEPGTRWQYSNTGFDVAALIIQKAAGVPFFQFVRERILEPLELESASDFDTEASQATDASGYLRYALGPLRPAPDAGSGWGFGMGMLAMTASDLARWDISLIRESLLSPASYDEMEKEMRLANGAGSGYGLGVDVGMQNGHFLVSHSGEMSGFTAYNYVFLEDGAAVVVLTNQDAAPAAGAIARGVTGLLFATTDTLEAARTARALAIFTGLQKGDIDRSLFNASANAYFSQQALDDFESSLAPLGPPREFVQTGTSDRGGMILRVYRAVFADRMLRVWTYELPDGTIDQFQVAPVG